MAPLDMRKHFQPDDIVEILINYNKGHVGRVDRVTAEECWVEDIGPYSSPDSLRLIERGGKPVEPGLWLEREPIMDRWCGAMAPGSGAVCSSTAGHRGQCIASHAPRRFNGRAEFNGIEFARWWGVNPDPGTTIPAPPPTPLSGDLTGPAPIQSVATAIAAIHPPLQPNPASDADRSRAEAQRLERQLTESLNDRDLLRAEVKNEKTARIKAEDKVLELTREMARMKKAGW